MSLIKECVCIEYPFLYSTMNNCRNHYIIFNKKESYQNI